MENVRFQDWDGKLEDELGTACPERKDVLKE